MMKPVNGICYGGDMSPEIQTGVRSLGDFIMKKLKERSDDPVLIDGTADRVIKSSEILKESLKIAVALRKYGIRQGDSIGMASENRFEFPCIIYASFLVGATITLVNPSYTKNEFKHTFNLSEPKIVFASVKGGKIITDLRKETSYIQTIIIFDKLLNQTKELISYDSFVGDSTDRQMSKFQCYPTTMRSHVSVIVTSSGTTGLPKGVQLTEWNIFVTIVQSNDRTKLLNADISILSTLPWFHVYGLFTTLSLLLVERTQLAFIVPFKAETMLQCIEKYKLNYLMTAPPVLVILAKSPLVDKYNLSSIALISTGSAPMSKELAEQVVKRFPHNIEMFVSNGYGMSETTLTLTGQSEEYRKPGSVGVLRPGLWGKTVDPETGKNLLANQLGEIVFKGDVIMKGYLKNDAATNIAIDPDGWLHTGDIGYFDEDGEWFVVDRIKELIKYKGYQVAPAELEAILLTHPDVKDTTVIGIPDDVAGELPLAFVVRRDNSKVTEKEIVDYVAGKVSQAKQLRGGVRFIQEIPKNTTGKILRRVLKDMLKTKSKL